MKFIFKVLMQYIMENIKTCDLCLEQIFKTEDLEHLNCDEKQNLTILKNLEINVSRDGKICSNCINLSHLTYNFKMSCLTNNVHLKTLIHPDINDKLILEEVIVKKTKSEFKNEEKVCRFCLNFSEVNSLVEVNLEQDVVLKDMLGRCLPEIDANIVQNPLICYICSELLEKLFNFMSQCEDTEVLGNLDTKTDNLVSENKPTVTNHDDNIDNSFVKEENCEGLEDPELQIKSEDIDIDEDIKDSINDSSCPLKEGEIQAKPSSSSSGLTHQQTHWKTKKSTKSRLYKCNECLLQFQSKTNLAMHKKNYEKTYKCNMCSFMASNKCESVKHKKVHQKPAEPRLFKCHKCPYTTECKGTLDFHNMVWHEDTSEPPKYKYKCDECPYDTIWKWALVNHKVTHQDPSEVKMYKCMKCSYQTKHKYLLQKHEKRHPRNRQNAVKVEQSLKNRDTINEKKFVCDICSYQTTLKYNFKQHCLTHKEPSEVNIFKCDYCPFATKRKGNLALHAIRHKSPSELPKFKCNDCPYETNNRTYLVRHVLVHRNDAQVVSMCPYQAKSRKKNYICDECSYKTRLKKSFLAHLRNHKKWKQSAESNLNLKKVRQYKCSECSYIGTRNTHLIAHQMTHTDPSEREMYSCTECSFQALYKVSVQRHYEKNHIDLEVPLGEVKSFRCNVCDYESAYKKCILKHLQKHEQEKMTPNVKEELQEQDSMHKELP